MTKLYLKIGVFLAIVCLTGAGMQAHAQSAQEDALRAEIDAARADTTRCRLLEALIDLLPLEEQLPYVKRWENSARAGYRQAKNAAERMRFISSYADALNAEGYIHVYTNHLEAAKEPFERCLEMDEWLGDAENIATAHNNIGYYYGLTGDASQSLSHYEQAMSIELRNQDTLGLAYTLGNIATLHEDQKNYDLALKNYAECLKICEILGDKVGVGRNYNYIAHVYIRLAQYDTAYAYCQRALASFEGLDAEHHDLATNDYLAFIALKRKDYASARRGFELSLQGYAKIGYEEAIASTLLDRQGLWLALHEPQRAEADALQALAMGKDLGLPEVVLAASLQLAKLYKEKQDYRQAMAMQEQYTALHDSLQNRSVEKSLLRTQFQFEYAQKAVADSIQGLQERAIFDLKLAQQKSQKRWLFLIVGLVALFAAFIWNRFRVTRRQKQQIEVANQDLSRQHLLNQKIFSVISHDFRGPILSLNLMLDALRDRNLDPSLQQFVGDVNAEVRNANEVLNNLLNWAKTEINIHELQQGTASLQAVAAEITAELGPKLRDKHIVVQHQYADDAKLPLPPDILRIVLRNLLSNAVKFSHAGQAVTVSYAADQQLLSVNDQGIGISPAKQAQLFKREVDTALGTANEEGFGMGLYIVAELLHKYGHGITVESAAATGTTFSIRPNRVVSL